MTAVSYEVVVVRYGREAVVTSSESLEVAEWAAAAERQRVRASRAVVKVRPAGGAK